VQEIFHQLLENAFGGFANFSLKCDEKEGQKYKMLIIKRASCKRMKMKKKQRTKTDAFSRMHRK
jgi:hypothetical protein